MEKEFGKVVGATDTYITFPSTLKQKLAKL
jgi:hypothetical protein